MMKKEQKEKDLIKKKKQSRLLFRQELRQQTQQVNQQKKVTFKQLENLISLAKKAQNPQALKRWKKAHKTKEQNWANSLLKGQQKLWERRNPLVIVKSAPLYSQLRKQIRQEEKFLYLRQKHPQKRITWTNFPTFSISFADSQEINKRTNLALRELGEIRKSQIKDYKEKVSWSLRKQRARIRRVRGKIDEAAYQQKLTERNQFRDQLKNYHGKLAQEKYWSKKFRASPISLAQAELIKLKIQPDYQDNNYKEAEKLAFQQRKNIPKEVFDQPWLSYKEEKTAKFSSIFGTGQLRRVSSIRQPLIEDKLKEYHYKINFYQLFNRLPSEKEIRKFASINWVQEKQNYELLWEIKQRGHKKLDIPLLPWGPSRWAMTQKQILQSDSLNEWWRQAGDKELALLVSRMHQLDPQTKFWATGAKRYQDPGWQRSLLSPLHPAYQPYVYELSENYQLDQVNKQYLNKEIWARGKKVASEKWIDYLQRAQEQLRIEGINAQLHFNGLYSSFILSKCSVQCQCNVIGGTEHYETQASAPWCETCRIFNTTTKFIFADKSGHPPLAPGQCPYLNSSHWSREEYGKINRWTECGSVMPQAGETWHHDFDAWHAGKRGWGCHLAFPQVMSRKQRSRVILVKW